MTVYMCGNQACSEYHKEFSAMDIADAILATGRRVCCGVCGQVCWFVRKEIKESKDGPDTVPSTE